MAVQNFNSDQMTKIINNDRLYPIEEHGKLRQNYAFFKNLSGAVGDANSTVELFRLPPGRLSLRPLMSVLRSTAFGASRVVKIGHRKYARTATEDVAEDDDAFSSAVDISAAGMATSPYGTQVKYDLYSLSGITVFATITGGNVPTNAELETYLSFIYE
jgi:hypothetical protein